MPAGSSAATGTGTLQLSLGGTSFTVTVNSSNDTVAGIAAAINSATGNPGIEASVVTGTDGAHLVLTSSLTGASNTIQVSETDGGTALSDLTYGTGNTGNYTEPAGGTPQDAEFSIAGRGIHQRQQHRDRRAERRHSESHRHNDHDRPRARPRTLRPP